MEDHNFLLQLFLILISARLLGELAAKCQVPSVIGELFAGILIGPSLLHWTELTPLIKILADIGVILLLFEVGLETNLHRLIKTGIKPFVVAFGGVIAPFALGFLLSYSFFQMNLLVSLLIGSTLTATSIGITMRVLSDLKKLGEDESQIVLGAAVIDDIIGIILLAIVYEFSKGSGVNFLDIGKISLFIVLFLVLAPFAARVVSSIIKRYETNTVMPGLLPTSIVSVILFFSWIAYKLGAPELIGGFAAGLALSPHFFFSFANFARIPDEFTHKVENEMKPIIHLFTPIFFVAVGLSLNLKEMDWSSSYIWVLSISLFIAAVVGKLVSGFLLWKDSRWIKWAVGLAMIPRGEMGLVFAEVGKTNNIVDSEAYAALVLVITATTLFAPFAMRWYYGSVR
jgi:Kef-type K+ transport system membrane component KefB